MIKHTQIGDSHELIPMNEKAARFLNGFVFKPILMTAKEFESCKMEMAAYKCWIMGEAA
jgi:hypothetical protein